MTFFEAQKKLVKLWFIWSMVLLAYVGFHTIFSGGAFSPPEVAAKIWAWIGKYLASIFTLIVGSSFFNKETDSPVLKSPIYFNLSFFTSVFYLAVITVMIFVVVLSCDSNESFLTTLDNTGFILLFLLPIVTGLLGYFFYKSKNQGNAADIQNKSE